MRLDIIVNTYVYKIDMFIKEIRCEHMHSKNKYMIRKKLQ
jgi:hypothetical protein